MILSNQCSPWTGASVFPNHICGHKSTAACGRRQVLQCQEKAERSQVTQGLYGTQLTSVHTSTPEKSPVRLRLSDHCRDRGAHQQAIIPPWGGDSWQTGLKKKQPLLIPGPQWTCFPDSNLCSLELIFQVPSRVPGTNWILVFVFYCHGNKFPQI